MLDKDGTDVGQIKLSVDGKAVRIEAFTPADDEVRESALRQLATYVRKHYPEADRILVETDQPGPYLNVNFVQDDLQMPDQLMKLIRY